MQCVPSTCFDHPKAPLGTKMNVKCTIIKKINIKKYGHV